MTRTGIITLSFIAILVIAIAIVSAFQLAPLLSQQTPPSDDRIESYEKLKDFLMFERFDLSAYPNGELLIWTASEGEKKIQLGTTIRNDPNAELFLMPNFDRTRTKLLMLTDGGGGSSVSTGEFPPPFRMHKVEDWSGPKGHLLAETYDKKIKLWGMITPADHESEVSIDRQLARIEEAKTEQQEELKKQQPIFETRPKKRPISLRGSADITNETMEFQNDFGSTPSQSFVASSNGLITGIQLSIAAAENSRELLIVFRSANEHGYPSDEIIGSGIAVIPKEEPRKLEWHSIPINATSPLKEGRTYTFTLIPSTFSEDFGYFLYGYSDENQFTSGRLLRRSQTRSVPKEDGLDLGFRIFIDSNN